jgi:ubiquinone/menaquinone biosynthesis C-methylase UbiE
MSGFQLSNDAPTAYADFAMHIMAPWTDDLITQGLCKDGNRMLDLACGTGFVADRINQVSKARCEVVGVDVNQAMLDVAKKNTLIEWRLASATELPFEDGSFDVVLCQQGMQFFPDRGGAMKEVARVLKPEGRLSLNVWGALDRQVFHSAFVDGIGIFLGAEAKAALDSAFSLDTVDALRGLASEAGLRNIRIRFEQRTMRHPVAAELAAGFIQATPLAGQFRALPEKKRNAFAEYVGDRLRAYIDDAGLAAPMENHFLTAIR